MKSHKLEQMKINCNVSGFFLGSGEFFVFNINKICIIYFNIFINFSNDENYFKLQVYLQKM